MRTIKMRRYLTTLLLVLIFSKAVFSQQGGTHFIKKLVKCAQFANDKDWYLNNIPFFECSDADIENVYYYRWLCYKAHLKNLGPNGYIVTEFLNTMGWDLKPYNSLNDATAFHIYEGRWLRDKSYVADYINFMYQKGGNDRHFSEAIADAAYAYYLVNPDKKFIISQLASMDKIYNAWYDHFDKDKQLYYIEPLLDATEYTISSIDASGGKDGFRGGDAFRPSINSFMYANALAIKNIALLNNDTAMANSYLKKANAIKSEMQKSLWNDSLKHFIDRYKVDNDFVHYWNFIRGRELVGFVPWAFNLPDDNKVYATAWKHLLDTTELYGRFGLRTNEPAYQYYMRQYRYVHGTNIRECQWNGPSWPFQTSQVLLGMANMLNNYHYKGISADDYMKVLKQYTLQHYMGNKLNIVEDYDPDKGGAIVNIDQRSENYNHSEYNDLIITGMCGIRPAEGDVVVINPLIDASKTNENPISYFCLENVLYHGHNLTVLYDKTGTRYHLGAGLSVYVDGRPVLKSAALGKHQIKLPAAIVSRPVSFVNLAVNSSGKGFPQSSASYTDSTGNVNMANDGRTWFFNNVRNYWSNIGSPNKTDWYQVDFGGQKQVRKVVLAFYSDSHKLVSPAGCKLTYWNKDHWQDLRTVNGSQLVMNTSNRIEFNAVTTDKIRLTCTNDGNGKYVALTEMEAY